MVAESEHREVNLMKDWTLPIDGCFRILPQVKVADGMSYESKIEVTRIEGFRLKGVWCDISANIGRCLLLYMGLCIQQG